MENTVHYYLSKKTSYIYNICFIFNVFFKFENLYPPIKDAKIINDYISIRLNKFLSINRIFYEIRDWQFKNYYNRKYILNNKNNDYYFYYGEKKYPILGYIDRIDNLKDNNLTIIDYKTSKSMPYMSQIREDLQLYTYALATKQIKGKYPKSMALWFVIHNRIAQVEFKEEVMNKVEEQLIEGIEQIESNNFEATPSYFGCTYCDFKDICKDSLK